MLRLLETHRRPAIRATLLAVAMLGLMLLSRPTAQAQGATSFSDGSLTLGNTTDSLSLISSGGTYIYTSSVHPSFFANERYLNNSVCYMTLPNGNPFGYYAYLGAYTIPTIGSSSGNGYIYHFDMGYEYMIDANDSHSGVCFYDFASQTFFYTSPPFPFPYLYDFTLKTVLNYFPDPANPGHYNTNGARYFYNFATGQVITK